MKKGLITNTEKPRPVLAKVGALKLISISLKTFLALVFTFSINVVDVFSQASLPTSFSGPNWRTALPPGWTQSGMGTDYAANYDGVGGSAGKIDGTGDYLQIYVNNQIGNLTYWLAGNSFSGGTFTVQESTNGSTWTTIRSLTSLGSASSYTDTPLPTSRYIRFYYTNKVSGNVGIDGVTLTAASCTPPSDPTGTITPAANPACGSTMLSYNNASTNIYWQTSATGTSTANPTTNNLTVTSSGTYYVRANSGSCWSDGALASPHITINTPPTINIQPANQTQTEPATATFSIVANNATGYQWQLSTDNGSTWSNISGATSVSYTTGATTTAMTGYQYQCIVSGNSPCTSVTSNAATLTVSTSSGACGTENFENIPSSSSDNSGSYQSRTWIGTDGVTWTAEGARTDQTLNGKAICLGTSGTRYVQSPTYSNGIGQLTFKYVRGFTGSGARTIQVLVNNVQIGSDISVSPTSDVVQTYSQAINIAGDVVVEIASTGAGQVIIDDISWTCFNVTVPTLIASPDLLSGFHYIYGSGPSSVQSFSLSGVLLSGAPGNISLTAPANYEISLDNSSFLSELSIPYSSATLSATTVYVRLKAGLSIGAYNNEMINISGGGVVGGASVECKGYVSSSATQAIAPGDLAILAFNYDIGLGEDEISFVCFVPIPVGAIIDITDNAYEKCGINPNGWGISEGWIRFERKNTPLPEGEVVTVRVLNGTPSVVSPDPTNWTASKPQPSGQGIFDMNKEGEQIFFLSGIIPKSKSTIIQIKKYNFWRDFAPAKNTKI